MSDLDDMIERIAADQMARGLSDWSAERELRAALQRQGVSASDADCAVLDAKFARCRLAFRQKQERLQIAHDHALATFRRKSSTSA